MQTKECRKVVKTYNKIARAIIEFETLWLLAWRKGIESAKSGLQATLLVRHPQTQAFHVNFDREILQLLRETKCLIRMGVDDVPETAKMVLMQQDKLKNYYNLLAYALSEYEVVMSRVTPIIEPLLKKHMLELEAVIQPGLLTLTWTSMNIDAYLYGFHSELMRFNELIFKLTDIIDNRLHRNLDIMSGLQLLDLPEIGRASCRERV